MSKRCRESVISPRMNKASTASIRVAALMIMVGCSSKPLPEGRSQARVVFQSVQDPIRELCTDDTSHRTDYFTGLLVRFEASTIVLNGARSSAGDLLGWAQKKYERSAEPTLWVQFSPDSTPLAESTLLRLVQSLPHLKLRRVHPDFNCGNRQLTIPP